MVAFDLWPNAHEDLVLDDQIRNWVLLPVTTIMILISVLRHLISKVFQSPPQVTLEQMAEREALVRSQKLRLAGSFISSQGFEQRKLFFTDKENGFFNQISEEDNDDQPQMPQMDQMNGVMVRYMQMLVPQIIQMAWISYFFSGFVLVKLPFPLTLKFRGTLQQGLELRTLDVRYVSALSWYFLNTFGLRGILPLILGEENAADDARVMQAQMGMGQAQQMAKVSTAQKYKTEKESLALVNFDTKVISQASQRLWNYDQLIQSKDPIHSHSSTSGDSKSTLLPSSHIGTSGIRRRNRR